MIKKMMTPPNNLSKEPYLTEWHADLESGLEIWIQTSEDTPKWERLGNIFEKLWIADTDYHMYIEGKKIIVDDVSLEKMIYYFKK